MIALSVTWTEALSPVRIVSVGKSVILNGGFEAGTLDPWVPEPSAYVDYATITVDAYEGNYCLALGPTRMAHGAPWVGVYQDITPVSAPFALTYALKKVSPATLERAGAGPITFKFTGLLGEMIAFTAYRGDTAVGSGTMTKDWNLIEIKARPADFDLIVNGTKIATVSEGLTLGRVELWTATDEYIGGSFLFDSVSLIEEKDYIVNGGFEAGTLDPWRPVPSAYVDYVKLVHDGYEGSYCLECGPTRAAHGATWCGAEQDFNERINTVNLSLAFQKVDATIKDIAGISVYGVIGGRFGESIGLQLWAQGDGTVDVYMDSLLAPKIPLKSGWNTLRLVIDSASYWHLWINDVFIGSTVRTYGLYDGLRLWTAHAEYVGGSWRFDAVSLTK